MGSATVADSNAGVGPYTYTWSNGATSLFLTNVTGGTYYVTTTNSSGCKGVAAITVPQALPAGVSVCMVTVDTIQKTTIIWNRTNERNIQSFNLYRKASNATTYILRASFCAGISTIYTDSVSNTASLGYNYEVSEVDSCGNESPMSPAVNSILMTATNNGSSVVLNWAAYQGTFGSYYYIYRDTVKNVFVLYDSVANNVLTYTDTKPLATNSPVYYTIGVSNLAGCSPTQVIENRKGKGGGPYTKAKSNTGKLVHGAFTSVYNVSEQNSVSVYPNPGNGVFTVAIKNYELGITNSVEVYNIIGEKVYAASLNPSKGGTLYNHVIDISNQSNGLYLYRIVDKNGALIKSGKLVKE